MSRKTGLGFTFKGISSDTMRVRLMAYPDIPQPARRGKSISIPGRNGTLWADDGGYESIDIDIECRTMSGANLDSVAAWLSDAGNLVLHADPSRCFRARIIKSYSVSKAAPGCSDRNIKVKFTAQPFRYLSSPSTETLTTGKMLVNPGTAPSEPIITVYGSGDVAVLVGPSTILIENLNGSIVLDCEAKLAYQPGDPPVLKTGSVTLLGEGWPVIPVGGAGIQWTGAVSKVEVQPNWRWL